MELRLRPPRLGDERAVAAAHDEMAAEHFPFALSYEPGMSWSDYLAFQDLLRRGIDVPAGLVPSTFLLAEVDGEIIGRSSIRHSLGTEFLEREGGHIGYCVVAGRRRCGYATEILRQSLVVIRALGVDRVLITCDDDNAGSAAVIERCGGKLESLVEPAAGGTPKRRYWID